MVGSADLLSSWLGGRVWGRGRGRVRVRVRVRVRDPNPN